MNPGLAIVGVWVALAALGCGETDRGSNARTLEGGDGGVEGGQGEGGLEITDGKVIDAPPTPALVESSPADGSTNVPRTTWVILEFEAAPESDARSGIRLDCDGEGVSVDVDPLDETTLVVNPRAALPGGAACIVSFIGPDGPVMVGFETAPAGAPAVVPYNREDLDAIAPFPDDYFLSSDEPPRMAVPVPPSPGVQLVLGAAINYASQADGASPLAPIVVALPAAIDPASIPVNFAESLEPLASVALFDLEPGSSTYRERVPFVALSRDEADASGAPAHNLLVFPGAPLGAGGTYGFVVTNRALVDPSRPLEASAFFRSALDRPTTTAQQRVHDIAAELFTALGDLVPPLREDDAALALRFRVRSDAGFADDLLEVRRVLDEAEAPAFSIASVTEDTNPSSDVAAIVRGTWSAPVWGDGTFFTRGADGLPVASGTDEVPFILALPRAALSGAVPITWYQHGQPGSAEDEVPRAASRSLAGLGFAVVGFTDVANRDIIPDGDVVQLNVAALTTLLGSNRLPEYLSGLTLADQLAFVRLIPALGSIDVLPVGAPDGVPDIDASAPLTYLGISQGATHGVGLLAYAPEVHAAALVAGGGRFIGTLVHQASAPLYNGITAFFPELTRAQFYAGMALVQIGFDPQDPLNHARYLYRAPHALGATQRASVLQIEGLGDSLVPAYASRAAAFAFGIPQLEPASDPVPFLASATGPLGGNLDSGATGAFVQYVPAGYPLATPTPGCASLEEPEGHYCAQRAAESLAQRAHFFETALDGVPEIR